MEYQVNESVPNLVEEFDLFIKGGSLGVAPTLPGLPGSISSVADTAKGEFLVSPILSSLDISIIAPTGSLTAGQMYFLTCSVSVVEYLVVKPSTV